MGFLKLIFEFDFKKGRIVLKKDKNNSVHVLDQVSAV
jgi:hypothetical protein